MIFDPVFIDRIIRHEKTVTRRPANSEPCGTRVGSIQKIQPGQGQPAIPGRIHIHGITLERLSDITNADARREGFAGRSPRAPCVAYFKDQYGGTDRQLVYRIEFEYVPAS